MNNIKAIQNVITLPADFKLTFNFKGAGIVKSYRLDELPKESLLTILQYGTRKGNDFVNSAFAEDNSKLKEEYVSDFLKKLKSGDFTRKESDGGFIKYLKGLLKACGETEKTLKDLKVPALIGKIAIYKGLGADKHEAIENALRKKYQETLDAVKNALDGINV